MVNSSSSLLRVVRGQPQMHLATMLAITAPEEIKSSWLQVELSGLRRIPFFWEALGARMRDIFFTEIIQNV